MEIKNKPFIFRKIIATLIDYSVLSTITFLYIKEFGEPDSDGGYSVHGIKALLPPIMWFIYLPLTESLFSTTLGHWIVRLKIVDKSGGSPDIFQSLKRRIADFVDIFFWGLPAIIAINKSENNQRLGDLWAGTLVMANKNEKITNN